MEYLSPDDVFKEFLRKYERNPKGWSFLVGRSLSFWDILIIGPEDAWQLKVDTIFKPKPFALGVKLKEEPQLKLPPETLEGTLNISYGFRPLPTTIIKSLVGKIKNQQIKPEDVTRELLNHLKNVQPKPGRFLPVGTPVAVGPHVILPQLNFSSEKQKELNLKLENELRKLLREKYSFYGF